MGIDTVIFSTGKDDWGTPQDLFDELNEEFHFDLDVAASKVNAKCKHYYHQRDNGLISLWYGNVWCNPPYSNIPEFVKRCSEYDGLSVLLLPSRTDTKWFHDYIYKNPRCEIRFIRGRLRFQGAESTAPFPSMIVIYKAQQKSS